MAVTDECLSASEEYQTQISSGLHWLIHFVIRRLFTPFLLEKGPYALTREHICLNSFSALYNKRCSWFFIKQKHKTQHISSSSCLALADLVNQSGSSKVLLALQSTKVNIQTSLTSVYDRLTKTRCRKPPNHMSTFKTQQLSRYAYKKYSNLFLHHKLWPKFQSNVDSPFFFVFNKMFWTSSLFLVGSMCFEQVSLLFFLSAIR